MSDSHNARLQKVLMGIIEGFSDYFITELTKRHGKTPHKIEVRNISVEKRLGATGIHIVKVSLESEFGRDIASIAVKIYEENEQASTVVKQINLLANRIAHFSKIGILSSSVIFFSGSVVIMEGIQGDDFRDSKIPKPQKYRLAGKCLAAFHGAESERPWFGKYKLLTTRSLEAIPVDVYTRESLKEAFSKVVEQAEKVSVKSGSVNFGDFHPGNLIFDLKIGRKPIIQTYIIDPEFLDMSNEHDRLEDICNFFVVEAVDQYKFDKSLTRLCTNLKAFLAGYNEILALQQESINSFYQNSYIPINFHLALMILMSILNIQNMTDVFQTGTALANETNLRCELIKKLLDWPTFPD
ncbi:MAG: phosphotransferase [Candidatus Hodarchaeales archaeon]